MPRDRYSRKKVNFFKNAVPRGLGILWISNSSLARIIFLLSAATVNLNIIFCCVQFKRNCGQHMPSLLPTYIYLGL